MRDSYRPRQLKENMINHLPLLFLIFNLFTFLFAADEVNKLPLETSPSLRNKFQPTLPQMNINYEVLAPNTNRTEYLRSQLNFQKESSPYCPHVEILTIILKELKNLLPYSSEKIKHVLLNYYKILENSLNSKHSAESLDKFSSENRLQYIEYLAEKLMKMDDKNAKIKISFEYELPTIHKTICEKLCKDLIHFANPENIPTDNDLNYANEQGKMKNNIMTILQNYRPDNINSNSPSYNLKLKKYLQVMNKPDSFYPQYSDTLSSNQVSPNIPILDSSQSQSQLLSNHTETAISHSLHNLEHLLQSPTETDFYSKENLSLPLLSPTEKTKLFLLPNFAFLPLSLTGTPNTAKHSKLKLSLQLPNSKGQNSIPMLPTYTGSSQSYPLPNLAQLIGINHLQMLEPHSHIPSEAVNPYEVLNYANPLPQLQGNINLLQNAGHFSQNAEVLEDSYPIQNLAPQQQGLLENSKEIEKFETKNNIEHNSNKNSLYHYETQELVQNAKGENAVQYISKNNLTAVTPKTFENIWSHPLYFSGNNMYSNNEKLLQEKPIQSYSQHELPASNLVPESNKRYPANFYQNLNANALSSIKKYESEKLQIDSLSAQASPLAYKPYLQPVKQNIYPETNPATGYLLNYQIPYSYQKIYPFSYEKNNAIYNSLVKKNHQLATHSNIPSKLALYPNSYYYYPNLGITNSAKDTQESYGVQFQDLNRLLGVSNLDKLNSASSKNEIVELTFKINNSKHSVEPFFYLKFRLPYVVFLFNLNKLLLEKPNLRKDLPLLLKHLIIDSNITSSNAIKNLNKDELLRLLYTNDMPVTARVLDANDTSASEQIKIIQDLNANMPLKDIIKTDAKITKVSEFTTKIPSVKHLRDRGNYLNDFQRTISGKKYFLNPYKTKGNQNYNEYVQHLTNLNRKPTHESNYLQNKPNNPYSSYGLNSFSRYNKYRE